ncbi:esterase [Mycobacterium angelicum]|uniref:DUF3298 domain-containing protein n=1 Tax=Mycobacterium angelicum TaxID=470074 RepID=A0A1W9ZY53_MYCAN|nr:esterase [Mycobacterium angelicum]MCV7198075.1 DUF3298 domain-containing protein [Mycobacterium angelicum]ORA22700.1 hypothetical protein BST12_09015 [Mycobacterium angelicum]
MKRIALIVIIATVAIAGVAACGTSTVTHPAPAVTTTTPAAQGQSACTDLNGTVGPDQICHVRSVTATYKIDIGFPLDYPDLRPVTGFLDHGRAGFIDWVTTIGPRQKRGRPYEYVVTAKTYRSGTPDSGTQSLVLHIDDDTGLANEGHPNTTFAGFNFDLAKRSPITFETLFRPGTHPLEVLNPIVERQLHAAPGDLTEETYQNFALTDNAVIFFFGQNQVVTDNNGPHRVAVPRTELASLLA